MLVPAGLILWVFGAVAGAPMPAELAVIGPARYGTDAATRATVFHAIARQHDTFKANGRRQYPDDAWSAEDDYHWNVHDYVEKVAVRKFALPASAAWAIYDEGVHRQLRVAPPRYSGTIDRRPAGPLPATVLPLRPRAE